MKIVADLSVTSAPYRAQSGEIVADTTAPVLQTSTLAADGVTLTLSYNETLAGTALTTDYSVSINGNPQTPTTANRTGMTVVLGLTSMAMTGDTVTASYSGTAITDPSNNPAAQFAGQTVTNNSTQSGTIPANFTSVNTDGWSVTYPSPPTFDPVGNPEMFTVTRNGFNGSGTAVTLDENLTNMQRIRLPYPNQASLTADQVSLSDFVYAGDVVAGAVNNATRLYPRPICMWLDHDLQRASGSYTAKLAVAHAHARKGRPVAAVKFIASDGVNVVEQIVSTMTATTYAASGLTVPHFEATLSFATLAANAMITIDAVIFPWVGTAFQASVDGSPYPSINFTTMKVLNDVSYGTAYAYVDATGGNDTTGVASTAEATAQASPYATIGAAATAVQAFNNTTFARNSASGGIVRLVAGTHTITDFSAVLVTDIPLVIEAAVAAQKSSTILRDIGANNTDINPDLLKVRNLTLQATGDWAIVLFSNNAGLGSANMLVLEGCDMLLAPAKTTNWESWIAANGRVWVIDSYSETVRIFNVFSTLNNTVNAIGCDGVSGTAVYNSAGTKAVTLSIPATAGNREAPAGTFFGHCFVSQTTATKTVKSEVPIGPAGAAFVGTVVEYTNAASQPAFFINGDGNLNPVENVVVQHLTVIGDRTNVFYNDAGNIVKSGYMRNSVFREWNSKSDVFASNGTYIGNWPSIYHVGHAALGFLKGSSSDDVFNAGSWLGEVRPLASLTGTDAVPLNPAWANDASKDGTGLGGGDYTPGPANDLPTVPAGQAAYPVTLKGVAIPDDGTAIAGAM